MLKRALEADESGVPTIISAINMLETLAADLRLLSENIEAMGHLAGKMVTKTEKDFATQTTTRLQELSLRNEQV